MPDPAPRLLTCDDAEAAAGLIRATFAAITVPVAPPPSALCENAGALRAILTEGGGFAVDAPDRGLAACVLWRPEEGGVYLCRLAVAPAHQGRGLARQLIAAVEAEARRRGAPRLRLSTRLALVSNRRLFAAAGFVETSLHAHEGFSAPTWVDMEKSLAVPA